jgi:hypothetical protein
MCNNTTTSTVAIVIQTKRNTYLSFNNKIFKTSNNWADRNFIEIDPSLESIVNPAVRRIVEASVTVPGPGMFTATASSLSDAYDQYIAHLKAAKLERDNLKAAGQSELERQALALMDNPPISLTFENIRTIMRYLHSLGFYRWEDRRPVFTSRYYALPYDCDGRFAITFVFDDPVLVNDRPVRKFVVGAPSMHYLKHYYHL